MVRIQTAEKRSHALSPIMAAPTSVIGGIKISQTAKIFPGGFGPVLTRMSETGR
jgi:hypothetical protein